MTQEDKELLLKDLSARLPYGVNVLNIAEGDNEICILDSIFLGKDVFVGLHTKEGIMTGLTSIKPYLRPMDSMTEEELNECVLQSGIKDVPCPNWQDIPKEEQFRARLNHAINVFLTDASSTDWLNAHHFDYRGLIKKGLAIEVTAENNPYKQ